MAAPVVESVSTAFINEFATTIVIDKPSGTQPGDLLVCHNTNQNGRTMTAPSGWTLLVQSTHPSSSSSMVTAIFYKIAGSSEPSTYTFTYSAITRPLLKILRISGASEAFTDWALAHTANSQFPNSPSVTAGAGDLLLALAEHRNGSTTFTHPSGMSLAAVFSPGISGTTFSSVASASEVAASAGATGTRGWFNSPTAIGTHISIAIAPGAGGGPGTDDLTATGVSTGAPTLGTPAIGQTHALTANGATAGAPTTGQPALGQTHQLTATGATTGAPTVDSPALGVIHNLAVEDLSTGAPSLGMPALGQAHALTATGVAAGFPETDAAVLGQVHELAATGAATRAPTTGTPSLSAESQVKDLEAVGIAAGAPSLGSPALGQTHGLSATGASAGTPALGAPALAQAHGLIANDNATGAPTLGAPGLAQIHVLAANGIAAGRPELGAPILDGEPLEDGLRPAIAGMHVNMGRMMHRR